MTYKIIWFGVWLFCAETQLLLALQTQLHEKHNLTWREDTTWLVYVPLRDVEKLYTVENGKDGFAFIRTEVIFWFFLCYCNIVFYIKVPYFMRAVEHRENL